MKFFSTTVLIALMHVTCLGQSKRNNNWAFGDSVGLNFSTAIPTVDTNYVLYSLETSSSISDSSGNLLFYASAPLNGSMPPFYYQINVWNNQGQVMPNGDSLVGEATVTQGTLILPTLYDTSLYYVFTIGKSGGPAIPQLYYSIVDMKLDSGRGDVTVKNVQLTTFAMAEKMTLVRHGNGRDWWLITHDIGCNFVFFLITPSGISGPFLQLIGTYVTVTNLRHTGQICVSPDGSRLCLVGRSKVVDLYDFDRCNGTLGNWIYLGDTLYTVAPARGAYGCSFSPNSKVLYVSTLDTLFQYDLNAANIAASSIVIHFNNCQNSCCVGQHMLAPNGYIYLANTNSPVWDNYPHTIYNNNINYIENPNVIGLGCGFHYLGQYLNGRVSLGGLPNMANYELGRDSGSVCDTLTGMEHVTSPQELISLKPNPAKDEVMISSSEAIKNLWILNIKGEMIFEWKDANVLTEKINTTSLSNGVYMVRMETGNGMVVKKLVVLRK